MSGCGRGTGAVRGHAAGPTPPGNANEKGLRMEAFRGAAAGHRGPADAIADQFSGVFLPSLYVYRVMAGFFISPLGSKAMLAVTPLKLDLASSGM